MKAPNVKFVFSALFFVRRRSATTRTPTARSSIRRSIQSCGAACRSPRSSPTSPTSRIARNDAAADRARLGVRPRSRISSSNAREVGRRGERRSSRPSRSRSAATISCSIPSHLWLTIHESIGHPTELDRAMGYEANYAGTSFVAPPEKMLGKLQVRPGVHEHPGRPLAGRRAARRSATTTTACSRTTSSSSRTACFNDYQTTREQARVARVVVRPADAADAVARLLVRATAGAACSSSACPTCRCCRASATSRWDDLIAATDSGIAIVGDGSFSIDQQRYNAQFGGQVFYEIKGGKIVGMLKDVAYQIRTPDFWNSMDMIGGKAQLRARRLASSTARVSRGQINAVSHGCRAGALPQRQRHQHGEESMSARSDAACSTTTHRRRRLIERSGRSLSKADGVRRARSTAAYTRQHPLRRQPDVDRRAAIDRRRSSPSQSCVREQARGRHDQRPLRRRDRGASSSKSETLAKLAPDDPEVDAAARRRSSTSRCSAYFDVDRER